MNTAHINTILSLSYSSDHCVIYPKDLPYSSIERIADRYFVNTTLEIGRGADKTVYEGFLLNKNKECTPIACAVFNLTGNLTAALEKADKEYNTLLKLNNGAYLVKCLAKSILKDKKKEVPVLYYEYLPLSLSERLRDKNLLDENEARKINQSVKKGLQLIHDHNIVHGDVKAANVLLTVDRNGKINKVKLTDFGNSTPLFHSPRSNKRMFTDRKRLDTLMAKVDNHTLKRKLTFTPSTHGQKQRLRTKLK